MKPTKAFILIVSLVCLFWSCSDEYEEPNGLVFEGTFVLRNINDIKNGNFIKNENDSVFMVIKSEVILKYIHAARDSSQSIDYYLDRESLDDIYGLPLNDINVGNFSEYKYLYTYRFNLDTLYLEVFPKKDNGLLDKELSKVLYREAWVRPGTGTNPSGGTNTGNTNDNSSNE